jgi:hypothetical protein
VDTGTPTPVHTMTSSRRSGGASDATVYVATNCPYGSGISPRMPVTANPIVPAPTSPAATTGWRRRHTNGTEASAARTNSGQPPSRATLTGSATVAR